MSESVVSPNGSGLASIRGSDRESARATLVRTPRFSGVGFLFILFSQAIEERHFRKVEIFPARDLAKTGSGARSCRHETLELAKRECSIDCALHPHGRRGDSV